MRSEVATGSATVATYASRGSDGCAASPVLWTQITGNEEIDGEGDVARTFFFLAAAANAAVFVLEIVRYEDNLFRRDTSSSAAPRAAWWTRRDLDEDPTLVNEHGPLGA